MEGNVGETSVLEKIPRLPLELQYLILSRLSSQHLFNLFQTCHKWYEFQKDKNFWRYFYQWNYSEMHEIKGLKSWKSKCKKMKLRRWLYEKRDDMVFFRDGVTLKNITVERAFGPYISARCETVFYSGKHYWEIDIIEFKKTNTSPLRLGISSSNMIMDKCVGYSKENGISYDSEGTLLKNFISSNLPAFNQGDCIGFYLDMDTPSFRIFKNGKEVKFLENLCSWDFRINLLNYISAASHRTKCFGITPSITLPFHNSVIIKANFNAVIEMDGKTIGFNGVVNRRINK